MSNDSRARMVRSAAALISTRGLNATSFSDVLADSGAPRGSIYHHFPDGKSQLAQEAVRWTSGRVLDHLRACPATTPAGVLEWFMDITRRLVSGSNGAAGCPIAGVAIDTVAEESELMVETRSAFRSWVEILAEQLAAAGIPDQRARTIAITVLAGMEGALILCRAEGGIEPLNAVAGELLRLVRD